VPDTLATVAAILLAGTFLIAASLKLVNPAATGGRCTTSAFPVHTRWPSPSP